MSKKIRWMFLKKQVAYVIVNLLVWVCFFLNAVYRLYINFENTKLGYIEAIEWIQTFSIISAISTGILFSIVRLFEPYLIFVIKKEVAEWFGIILEENQNDKTANDSLSAILVESLSVELVNVILKAIAYGDEKYLVDKNGN